MILTIAEIADLCSFTDAHNMTGEDSEPEIVVELAPSDGIGGVRTRYMAYFAEYPDEGFHPLGPVVPEESKPTITSGRSRKGEMMLKRIDSAFLLGVATGASYAILVAGVTVMWYQMFWVGWGMLVAGGILFSRAFAASWDLLVWRVDRRFKDMPRTDELEAAHAASEDTR